MTTRNTKKDGSRTYEVVDPHNPGETLVLPSVTTVLRVVNKPALLYWAANQVSNYAIENHAEIGKLLEKDDRDGAYRLLKGSPWSKRDKAADVGTQVHDLIEKAILEGKDSPSLVDVPVKAVPYVQAFQSFVENYEGSFEASEMTVFNLTHGYAGTLDALWKTPKGQIGALDWKTRQGKKVAATGAYET